MCDEYVQEFKKVARGSGYESQPLIKEFKRGLSVRLANSKARIKPTTPLSVFDKKNSIEFPLDFLLYLYKCLTLTLY